MGLEQHTVVELTEIDGGVRFLLGNLNNLNLLLLTSSASLSLSSGSLLSPLSNGFLLGNLSGLLLGNSDVLRDLDLVLDLSGLSIDLLVPLGRMVGIVGVWANFDSDVLGVSFVWHLGVNVGSGLKVGNLVRLRVHDLLDLIRLGLHLVIN